jgi:hypothetical protein
MKGSTKVYGLARVLAAIYLAGSSDELDNRECGDTGNERLGHGIGYGLRAVVAFAQRSRADWRAISPRRQPTVLAQLDAAAPNSRSESRNSRCRHV